MDVGSGQRTVDGEYSRADENDLAVEHFEALEESNWVDQLAAGFDCKESPRAAKVVECRASGARGVEEILVVASGTFGDLCFEEFDGVIGVGRLKISGDGGVWSGVVDGVVHEKFEGSGAEKEVVRTWMVGRPETVREERVVGQDGPGVAVDLGEDMEPVVID